LLNVGPKADGTIPDISVKCLLAVGNWLEINGDAIYGTGYGPVTPQPWGVTTQKQDRLFLHVMKRPFNGEIVVPGIDASITRIQFLSNNEGLKWKKTGDQLIVFVPGNLPDPVNTIIEVKTEGSVTDSYENAASIISSQYEEYSLDAVNLAASGEAKIESVRHSYYFGSWQHATCATRMTTPVDKVTYRVNFNEPGYYKIALEYACPLENSDQEGLIQVGEQSFYFETLSTGNYDTHWRPLMFIKHSIALVYISETGEQDIVISPVREGNELFKLSRIMVTPVKI
jgi:alpha-L-fucosidase